MPTSPLKGPNGVLEEEEWCGTKTCLIAIFMACCVNRPLGPSGAHLLRHSYQAAGEQGSRPIEQEKHEARLPPSATAHVPHLYTVRFPLLMGTLLACGVCRMGETEGGSTSLGISSSGTSASFAQTQGGLFGHDSSGALKIACLYQRLGVYIDQFL